MRPSYAVDTAWKLLTSQKIGTVALFAPAKVHFSAEPGDNEELYFKVAAGERAVLAGKFHGGVEALQAQRLDDGKQLSLALKPYPAYWQFDKVELVQVVHPEQSADAHEALTRHAEVILEKLDLPYRRMASGRWARPMPRWS